MSLVNDMLRDLEKRRGASTKDNENPDWSVAQALNAKPKKNARRVFVYTALISLLLAVFAWQYKKIDDSVVVTTTVFDSQAPNTALSPAAPIKPANKPKRLTELTFSQVDNMASVQLGIDQTTPYSIRRLAQGLSITLQGVSPRLGDKVIEPVAPIASFSVDELEGKTEVVLSVEGDFYHEVSRQPQQGSQLIVTVVPERSVLENTISKTVAPQVTEKPPAKKAVEPDKPVIAAGVVKEAQQRKIPTPVKKRVELTPAQWDQRVAKQVVSLMAKGRYAESEKQLKTILQRQSTAPESLALYLSLLLSQQRFAQAQYELDKLSQAEAAHPNMIAVQARLHLLSANPQQALDLLSREQPDIRRFPAYYEILAQSAQRAQQYPLAEKTYRALLETDTGFGDWWVGLGIALDAQGRIKTAASVYQRALNTERVAPSLKVYARQRLSALQLSAAR